MLIMPPWGEAWGSLLGEARHHRVPGRWRRLSGRTRDRSGASRRRTRTCAALAQRARPQICLGKQGVRDRV